MYQEIRKARLGELPTHQAIEDVKEGDMLVLHPAHRKPTLGQYHHILEGRDFFGWDKAEGKDRTVISVIEVIEHERHCRERGAKVHAAFERAISKDEDEGDGIGMVLGTILVLGASALALYAGWCVGDLFTLHFFPTL